jgi:rubredoxin
MGEITNYKCTSCDYEADIAAGRSCGFERVVETISCRDCRELYDAVADEQARDALMNDGRIRGNLSGIRCPKSPDHSFTRWRKPWPCPKCGQAMVSNGLSLPWD